MLTIERSSYSALDWLGDVGGLYDGLKLIAEYLIGPVAYYFLNTEQYSQIFGSAKNKNLEKGDVAVNARTRQCCAKVKNKCRRLKTADMMISH